jgi:hypothetical protein
MTKRYKVSKRKPTHKLTIHTIEGKNDSISAFDLTNHRQILKSGQTYECAITVNPNNPKEEALFLFGFKPPLFVRLTDYLEDLDDRFWKLSRINGTN